ncbi:MAG TPA: hypothetical protein PK507_04040 [bacterium]|nr:hypothetical protein [bacterium]
MGAFENNKRYKGTNGSFTDFLFDNFTDAFERRLDAVIDKDDKIKKEDLYSTKEKINILLIEKRKK